MHFAKATRGAAMKKPLHKFFLLFVMPLMVVLAAVAIPSTSIAAEAKDIIFERCQLKSDRGMRAMGRMDCDEHVESTCICDPDATHQLKCPDNCNDPKKIVYEYSHGVFRPANANDETAVICKPEITLHVCVGVGADPDG